MKIGLKNVTKNNTKVINERFPRIAQEFNFKLKKFEILKRKGKYIMKIIFAV